ncbi:hypothetical protein ACFP3Q_09815 [Nocardioides sp. GCM10027113]|uniref:hypothetical protein n=1 Tax=unclassified Nocardioides TaxID=2615069 RepID=UPI00360AB0F7
MTWKSFHRRGEVLRSVIAAANERRDGVLPWDLDGVAETFDDELALLAALQLQWHTRLAGRIERELMTQPMDLEAAVIVAWRDLADEQPGVLAVLDHYRAHPTDDAMAEAMAKSTEKEHILLAMMAGRSSAMDAAAARVGALIESQARALPPAPQSVAAAAANHGLLERIKAVLAA